MAKLEGHVFQPMTPWLEQQGIKAGGGWNVKSGCVPEEEKQVQQISKVLGDCNGKILKRVVKRCELEKKKRAEGKEDDEDEEEREENGKKVVIEEVTKIATSKLMREMKIRMEWRKWVQQFENCPTEEELRKVKRTARKLVNCPVDKYGTEGMMM